LIAAHRASGRVEYLDLLLRRNDRLIHHVLKRFSSSSEPYEDLFQVARLGLLKAVQRFDPERGTVFVTYAVAIMDGEVRHHLRDGLLLRQPRWARALYARIRQAQQDFCHAHGRSPSVSELAAAVNLKENGVLEIIRVFGTLDLHSLDEPFDDTAVRPDRTAFRVQRQETFSLPIEDRILLYEALRALSEMHKKILYLLFFKDLTQQQVADELGMTQRTVSRAERARLLPRRSPAGGARLRSGLDAPTQISFVLSIQSSITPRS